MPQNGLTLGSDATITIRDQVGEIISTITVQNFSSKSDATEKDVEFLSGDVRGLTFEKGYSGGFDVVRVDASVDRYFYAKEIAYYNKQNISPVTLTQTVSETDGSVTQYQFTGVTLRLDDAGSFSNENEVIQKVMYKARRRNILN